jgi:hypothetical protein
LPQQLLQTMLLRMSDAPADGAAAAASYSRNMHPASTLNFTEQHNGHAVWMLRTTKLQLHYKQSQSDATGITQLRSYNLLPSQLT